MYFLQILKLPILSEPIIAWLIKYVVLIFLCIFFRFHDFLESKSNYGVTIGVEKRFVNGQDYISIYVYDTGPGIEPEEISKIFDDFFTTGKSGGTGLGLAFCKRNMNIFKYIFNQMQSDPFIEKLFMSWIK